MSKVSFQKVSACVCQACSLELQSNSVTLALQPFLHRVRGCCRRVHAFLVSGGFAVKLKQEVLLELSMQHSWGVMDILHVPRLAGSLENKCSKQSHNAALTEIRLFTYLSQIAKNKCFTGWFLQHRLCAITKRRSVSLLSHWEVGHAHIKQKACPLQAKISLLTSLWFRKLGLSREQNVLHKLINMLQQFYLMTSTIRKETSWAVNYRPNDRSKQQEITKHIVFKVFAVKGNIDVNGRFTQTGFQFSNLTTADDYHRQIPSLLLWRVGSAGGSRF